MTDNELFSTLADSVGLVVDRTVTPELVLGQVCLLSKTRVAACASSVGNYVELPWALAVKFPHPQLVYSVKTVILHPDFSRREARTRYLAQLGLTSELPVCPENDIASMSLEPNVLDLGADKIAEANSLLAMPLTVTPQDISGSYSAADMAAVVERMATSGREGLLSLYDMRNRPLARLAVRQGVQGYVQRAIYNNMLAGELAIFEMVARATAGKYVFQSNTSFDWANARDIETPFAKLLCEATRRAAELPGFMDALGGPSARYVRAQQVYDPSSVHPNALWLVERLWTVLDGYLTLDKLAERIGADTYTSLRAIQEMLRLQIIVLDKDSVFSRNGQLGAPLPPVHEQQLSVGEPLTGFYLDPITSRPVLLQGAVAGRSATNSSTVLHSLPFPQTLSGGIVLKDACLLGLSSGPFVPPPGQIAPAGKLYQMTLVQALSDTLKKLKATGSFGIVAPDEPPSELPVRSEAESVSEGAVGRIGRFICPACRTVNVQEGNCQRCGADLVTGDMPASTTGAGSLRALQTMALGLSRRQLMIGGAALVLIVSICMITCSGTKNTPSPAPPPVTQEGPAATAPNKGDVQKAVLVATQYAGFKDTPVPDYVYGDASERTSGSYSFTLSSEKKNLELLCVVLDSTTVVNHLELVAVKVPYTDFNQNEEMKRIDNVTLLARGPSKWGGVTFNWIVTRYGRQDGTSQMALIGAYASLVSGKAILVIGRPLQGELLDYETTLWLIQTMAAPLIAKTQEAVPAVSTTGEGAPTNTAPGTTTSTTAATGAVPGTTTATTTGATPSSTKAEKKEATADELAAYVKKIEDLAKAKFSPPKEASKSKVVVTIAVGEDGALQKVELSNQSGDEAYDRYIEKFVQAFKYLPAPHVKDGAVSLKFTAAGAKLQVSLE